MGCLCVWLSSLKATIRQQVQPWLGSREGSYPSIFKTFAGWWSVEPFAHCSDRSDQRMWLDSDMPSPAKVFTYPQGGIWVAIPPKTLGRTADQQHALACFCWSHVWEHIRFVALILFNTCMYLSTCGIPKKTSRNTRFIQIQIITFKIVQV